MSRLISANFARLFKSTFFRICMILSAGLGIFLDVMRYCDIKRYKEIYEKLGAEFSSADGFVFSGAFYLIFFVAAFVGIFIGTEYSDGTIRNKLMIGRSRPAIYLSNLIVCSAASVMILLAFIIATLGVGIIILSGLFLTVQQIILFILMQCVTMTAFTAILVLLTMLIQSKAGGSVTVLILTIILLFSALTISDGLRQPEYYEDYTATYENAETGEMTLEPVMIENPNYLTGAKRKVYEFLDDFLPVNQFYQVSVGNESNLGVMAVYSAIITIAGTAVGIMIFRKKDLK